MLKGCNVLLIIGVVHGNLDLKTSFREHGHFFPHMKLGIPINRLLVQKKSNNGTQTPLDVINK